MFSKRKYVGDYRLGKTIGQGAFSKVKLGFHKITGEKVAVKIILKDDKNTSKKESNNSNTAKTEEKARKPPAEAPPSPTKERSNNTKEPVQKNEKPENPAMSPGRRSVDNSTSSERPVIYTCKTKEEYEKELYLKDLDATYKKAIHEEQEKSQHQEKNSMRSNAESVDSKKTEAEKPHENSAAIVEDDGSEKNEKVGEFSGGDVKEFRQFSKSQAQRMEEMAIKKLSKKYEKERKNMQAASGENMQKMSKKESFILAKPSTPDILKDDPPKNKKETKHEKQRIKDETKNEPEYMKHLGLEVKLLMRLNHPNIVKIFQLIETATEFYVIMEYAGGGELIDYIASRDTLSEKEARRIFRQIVSSLDHCHEAGVVHRDIKLENLLLSTETNILLSDFGLGRTFATRRQLLGTFCGTPLYASPEIVSGIKYSGPPADIWSAGVVLFVMMTGKPPFRGETLNELYKKIKETDYTFPDQFSAELKDFLRRIFVRDPMQRITMEEIRLHRWVTPAGEQPPPKIIPKFVNDDNQPLEKKYGALISGITQDAEQNLIYNFAVPPGVLEYNKKVIQAPKPVQTDVSIYDTTTSLVISAKRRYSIAADPQFGMPLPGIQSNSNSRRNSRTSTIASIEDAEEGAPWKHSVEEKPAHGRVGAESIKAPPPRQVRRMSLQPVEPLNFHPQTSNHLRLPQQRLRSFSNGAPTQVDIRNIEVRRESITSTSMAESPKMPISPAEDVKKELDTILATIPTEIRSVRFSFNTATTTSKDPDELVQLIDDILKNQKMTYIHPRTYTFECQHVSNIGQEVSFEIEVCKVWLLKLYGIKIRRLTGNALIFKHIYDRIIDLLKPQV